MNNINNKKLFKLNNKFGNAIIYSPEFLEGTSYITSAACMTIWTETIGWANRFKNSIVLNPEDADNIIVLSCQVTDLAILNDINIIKKLIYKYPNKKFFIGGCLAHRFDIKLPKNIKRLDHMRADYESVIDRTLVNYEKPFWVPEFKESKDEFKEGNLFRNMYPLRIGSGCHGKCKYCTIRITRGIAYNLKPEKLETEFANNNIVLIADSITQTQIRKYSEFALKYNKIISFRNVEPQNIVATKDIIFTLATAKLLKVLHTPVQAINSKVLKKMNRSKKQVDIVLQIINQIKKLGVFTATNIIIDYDNYENDFNEIYELFNYVSWNPYWNGNFDIKKAKIRMNFYIKNTKFIEDIIKYKVIKDSYNIAKTFI